MYFITTKSEVAVCLRKLLIEVKTAGHVTKVLLSDGGKEVNCEAVHKVLEEHGINHQLPNRMAQHSKKIVQLWKALALCCMPMDCRKNCGLKPVILRYRYSTVLDLHQWKVRHLWNCGLDLMRLLATCVFWGQNVMCIFPNRKDTNGTKTVSWVEWSDIWVKRMAIEFGYLTKGRVCWVVMYSLNQKLCAICVTSQK